MFQAYQINEIKEEATQYSELYTEEEKAQALIEFCINCYDLQPTEQQILEIIN